MMEILNSVLISTMGCIPIEISMMEMTNSVLISTVRIYIPKEFHDGNIKLHAYFHSGIYSH